MKYLILIAIFSSNAFAQGDIRSAEYYQLDGWPSEYPDGFQILSDMKVGTVVSPHNPSPSRECTLKKDIVIHPWAQKTKSEFAYLSPVSRYKAKRNFTLHKDEHTTIRVKKGDEVIQLSYLAEGFCRMSVNGEVGEESCLADQDKRAQLISTSAFGAKSYFKTACAEGFSGWVDALILSLQVEDNGGPVKSAVIVDFGEVEEP